MSPSSPFGLRRGEPSLTSLRGTCRACPAVARKMCDCRTSPSSPFGLRRGEPSLTSLRGTYRACPAVAREASEGWWSQAGSNRRPRHCERRALPAELWPHSASGKAGNRQQSAPFTGRAKAKSRTAKSLFFRHFAELPLFAPWGTDI